MELGTHDLKSIRVPSLAPSRQRAIADYLDRETARLDALVTAKEQMLTLLTERRQALIAATVVGGIDSARQAEQPDLRAVAEYFDREAANLVAAKEYVLKLWAEKHNARTAATVTGDVDSAGRAGLSELRATSKEKSLYESKTSQGEDRTYATRDEGVNIAVANDQVSRRKLKYLASVNDDVLDENTDVEFEMRYIDIGNVDSSGRISEIASFKFGDAPSRARRLVRDGDVIISTVRTYLQAITQIREPPENLVVSTGFAVVRPLQDRFDARYCRFALREPNFLAEVEKRSVGANYPAINVVDLADILIPVHSLPQQRAIADYLDRETARLDTLEVKIQGTIALLKERRAAIIAAAVTGQIDVERAA